MLYRSEIVVDRKVVQSVTFKNASHPSQAVRKLFSVSRPNYDYMTVYIMNEDGDYWIYTIRRVGLMYDARVVKHSSRVISRDIIDAIMAGNISIREVAG